MHCVGVVGNNPRKAHLPRFYEGSATGEIRRGGKDAPTEFASRRERLSSPRWKRCAYRAGNLGSIMKVTIGGEKLSFFKTIRVLTQEAQRVHISNADATELL